MKKRTFTVVVERDPESGWLVGEVVELPGCYTQAPDLSNLEKNVAEAIDVYLKTGDLRSRCPTSWAPGGLRSPFDEAETRSLSAVEQGS